ncbi:MAG: LuxR C-terminal-related transcriptional regulator, partial [Nannocystaceae bacterium]|nr:LuxR C-terminal-related transcriptional regulator [Nannocystaceae bacterium]
RAVQHVDALPLDRPYLHAFKSMHRAVLAMMEDRLGDARAELDWTRHAVRKTGDYYAEMWVEWQSAHVELLRGRLDVSRRAHNALLESAMNEYGGTPPSSALVGFGTAIFLELHLHDIPRAHELVTTATGLGNKGLDRRHGYVSCLLMPRALLEVQSGAGGDWQNTIDQAIRHLDAMDSPMSSSRIEAERVRLAMHPRSGVDSKAYATRWLNIPGIRDGSHEVYKPNPMPGVQVDHPRFVFARCLAAVGELDEALEAVEECIARSQAAQRRTCQVQGELLRAEILVAQGEPSDLARAVELAAAVGLVGPFVEFERSAFPAAIDEAQRQGAHAFAASLRAAHHPAPCPEAGLRVEPKIQAPQSCEALSERELEVLQLIAAGLSNAEASRKLFIAPSTVKKHLEHIYGKLGVNRRTQAVARARALGMIES